LVWCAGLFCTNGCKVLVLWWCQPLPRDCPQKGKQGPARRSPQAIGTIYGQLPSGYQVSLSRFPNYTTRRSLAPPPPTARTKPDKWPTTTDHGISPETRQINSSTQQLGGGVQAHVMELGVLPDALDDPDFCTMVLGEDIVSEPDGCDTGASHGFTGSKSLLHSFCLLYKPIPVSVATNGGGAKITGIGDLKFRGPHGQIIVLRHLLYCEHARTTLLSMAALRKADATVLYDNNQEAFKVFHRDRSHLFSCIFEPKNNQWCMPYPMIRAGCADTADTHCPTPNAPLLNSSFSSYTPISPVLPLLSLLCLVMLTQMKLIRKYQHLHQRLYRQARFSKSQ
jgi:hypothetical protein